jgi:hypothetical protein
MTAIDEIGGGDVSQDFRTPRVTLAASRLVRGRIVGHADITEQMSRERKRG